MPTQACRSLALYFYDSDINKIIPAKKKSYISSSHKIFFFTFHGMTDLFKAVMLQQYILFNMMLNIT